MFIVNGIENGFHIVDPKFELGEAFNKNHKSAIEVKSEIEKMITREIECGNYVITERKPCIVSPLGAVPKSGGGYRLIHDCSMPVGSCLNDYAPEFQKYSYETVDTAISLIKPFYYLAKIDIKSANRQIPIHPKSYEATGLQWKFSDGKTHFMYDSKLPFGARASPTIFHRPSKE